MTRLALVGAALLALTACDAAEAERPDSPAAEVTPTPSAAPATTAAPTTTVPPTTAPPSTAPPETAPPETAPPETAPPETAPPAPAPEPAPEPEPEPEPRDDCDPSYPGVCIPPSPPDLDCPDVEYDNFTVLPPDPHRFDREPDGIGCES